MKNRYTVVKICENCVFPQGLYRLRDKETGWKIIIEDKKDVDCIKDYLITKDEQIRSLKEQLKNAKQNEIYFIGGKSILSKEEIKNKDFLEVKELNVKDILDDYISKRGGFIDLVFATREAAEARLAELEGK